MMTKSSFYTWLLVPILLIVYLYFSLQIRSDMSFFEAENPSHSERIIQQYLNNGEANRIIFIRLFQAINTSPPISPEKFAQLSQQLRKKLLESGRFLAVENGSLAGQAVQNSQLYPYRYLLSSELDNPDYFNTHSLKEQLNGLMGRLETVLSLEEQQLIAEDPLNTWLKHLQSMQNTQLENQYGVWFNTRGEAILLLKTRAGGFEQEKQFDNIAYLNTQIKQILPKDISGDISGAAVIALEISQTIAQQIKVISSIASSVLALFLFSIFRSFKFLLLVSVPLIFALIVGSTVVMLFYGYIHGIALAFGITIIGVAVDYPIHYFSHLWSNSGTNSDKTRISHNKSIIITIWPKLKLGLLTTLIGFSAITFSSFSGLNQLGLFASSGLIAAALTTRYFLPYFEYKNPNSMQVVDKWIKPFNFKGRCLYRYILWLLISVAIIMIATHNKLWENDLSSLSPISNELKQKDFQLRKSLNLPELRHLLLISAESQQEVIQQSEQLSHYLNTLIKAGTISHYDTVSRYIPSVKTQLLRQAHIPSNDILEQRLSLALNDSPFDPQAFSAFVRSLQHNKQVQPLTPNQLQDSLISAKISSMLLQNKETRSWTSLVFLSGVNTERLRKAFNQSNNPFPNSIQLIDIKQQTNQLVEQYRHDALQWFTFGCIFIFIFLLVYTQSLTILPALFLPFSGAIILTIGSLLLFGYSLSIFHLVTLLLIVGLGIDYSIFIHDSKISKSTANSLQIEEKHRVNTFSVLVCSISSFIMFWSLSLSSIPVLNAIGLTASLGIILAFVLTLIFSRPCNH